MADILSQEEIDSLLDVLEDEGGEIADSSDDFSTTKTSYAI